MFNLHNVLYLLVHQIKYYLMNLFDVIIELNQNQIFFQYTKQ